MPTIGLVAFDGLKPIADPLLLEQGEATVAKNVRLISGALAPLKGVTALKALTKQQPKTIYRYGTSNVETEHWLEFTLRTDVMRSPITDNQFGILYWSDGVQPKYAPANLILSGSSYPGASYNLGVPAPEGTPSISGTEPTVAAAATALTVVYTYVTAYGEEGPPSPPSEVVRVDPDQPITVSGMSASPSGPYNITVKRVYISSTVGNRAEFQLWKEIPVAIASTTGAYEQDDLGEVIPSEDWVAPPASLQGLRMMANGIAVGFVENTAYASEPNLPHAWPHTHPADHRIVGVGTFGQSAVFLTDAFPYILSGIDPAAMSFEKLSLPQACVSAASIVETGNAVYYASPDGLVVISSGGIDIVTSRLLSREQWQEYNPSSIEASIYESRYIATYQKAGGQRGILIFDFSGQGALMTECDINASTPITAMHHDPRTDTLYLAQGGNIVRFDRGSPLLMNWRSKTFRMPYPMNFGYGQVLSEQYPVTLKVYADGQLKQTKQVPNTRPFRLISGFRGMDWSLEIEGSHKVTQVFVSTAIAELKSI